MAGTAVLEREIKQQNAKVSDGREITKEEREHTRNMSANYDFLRYSDGAPWTSVAAREKENAETAEKVSASKSAAQERIASYRSSSAPARNHALFENYAYIDGELLCKDPETEVMTPVFEEKILSKPAVKDVFSAPAYSVGESVATEEREDIEENSEDDALPTRRTMETVIRPAAAVQEVTVTETKTGFRAAIASLSAKTKAVLISLAVAILLAIVLICINTSIISSLDADISNLRGRAAEEQQNYETLRKESDLYTDPESDIVAEWAENNGMTK